MQATTGQDMPPLSELKPISEFLDLLGVNRSTAKSWIDTGCGPERVQLKAWLIKEWMTTEALVRDFIERKTAARLRRNKPLPPPVPEKIDTPSHRAAKAAMKKAGLLK